MTKLCSEKVNRGDSRWSNFQPCGRVAVEDGLCSLHLNVRKRRAAKEAERQTRRARGDNLVAEAEALSRQLGIGVRADYWPWGKGGGHYTGDFTVPGDWLRKQAT